MQRALSLAAVLVVATSTACNRGTQAAASAKDTGAASTEKATGFGFKCAWLAVKSSAPESVIARLGVAGARETAWQSGIDAAYAGSKDQVVYVTPAIDGWVLVAGTSLFSITGRMKDDEAKQPDFIASLSAKLGTEVQYFATHRVSEAHTWVRADGGKVVRAYGVGDGEVVFDSGPRTPAETELGVEAHVDEVTVVRIAAKWSVDPSTFESRILPRGWLGTYTP